MSPAKRRETVEQAQEQIEFSERWVCRAMEQPRSTQRYEPVVISDEELLTSRDRAAGQQIRPLPLPVLRQKSDKKWLSTESMAPPARSFIRFGAM